MGEEIRSVVGESMQHCCRFCGADIRPPKKKYLMVQDGEPAAGCEACYSTAFIGAPVGIFPKKKKKKKED